ncbi:MAG: MFS transporter [Gemmatimonadaceae bacterium]|nr:MFS transporter [Gemmatimonadaceae bacterium]
MHANARRPVNPFRVLLTHANFRRFWIGQTLSLVGTWMQSMAMGWLALELSDSAFVVGLVAASSALPILLFSLYAGVIVDRSDKLRIVRLAQGMLLVEAALLWYFTWRGQITVPGLIALATLGGIITSFEIPARQSLMIDLVGREDLRDAIALNSSGFNLARILGPAIAAAIIARWGLAWCFGVNAVSYLTVLAGLALIKLPPKALVPPTETPWEGMFTGVRHVTGDRRLRGLVETISVFAILCTPTLALMPVMAREQLGLGASGYGVLLSAVGIGGLIGALGLAASSARLRRGPLLVRSQFVLAGLILLISLSRVPSLSYVVLLATGCVLIVNSAVGNTIMQAIVPDEFRGRLMAIYSLIVVGLPQVVGAFAAGSVAGVIGISWTLALSAVLMAVYGRWAFRRYPEIRSL